MAETTLDEHHSTVEKFSQIALRTVVVLYTLGLYISNAYLSRYGEASFSLVKARYIMVGSTFAIGLLGYLYFSSLVNEHCRRFHRARRTILKVAAFLALPVFFSIDDAFDASVGERARVFGESLFWTITGLASLALCAWGARKIQGTLFKLRLTDSVPLYRNEISLSGVWGVFVFFSGITLYSWTAFPNEQDILGGGQLRVVVVHVKPDHQASLVSAGFTISETGNLIPMRLLATDGDTIVLLSPARENPPEEAAYRISKDAIDVISFEQFGSKQTKVPR